MTAIPEDIMQAARELARRIAIHHSDKERIELIARAILAERLAERERCAAITTKLLSGWDMTNAANQIATAIRSQKDAG